jgi:cytochrome c biogenesis protein CcmG/thiol:disulfide interchange protein DsbE
VPAEAPASPAEHGALRWIARGVAIIAAAAFLGLLAYGLTAKSDNKTIDDALARSKATPAPNFTLDVLNRGSGGDAKLARAMADGRLSLRELRGSPVILNFWASWCVPCRDEAPDLQLTWDIQRADGAIVLGLDQQDITSDARGFIRDFGLTYPMVRDGGDETAHRYGNTGIPETYFISARGDVVGHVIGAVSPNALSYGLEAARAGEPIPAKAGGPRKKT